jgi:hypothetical protein
MLCSNFFFIATQEEMHPFDFIPAHAFDIFLYSWNVIIVVVVVVVVVIIIIIVVLPPPSAVPTVSEA